MPVLNRGIEAGVIRYVLEQQPEVVPAFLVDPPDEKHHRGRVIAYCLPSCLKPYRQ
jgi:hypothetical protein